MLVKDFIYELLENYKPDEELEFIVSILGEPFELEIDNINDITYKSSSVIRLGGEYLDNEISKLEKKIDELEEKLEELEQED